MIEQTGRAIDAAGKGPVALIGSSLGAFVALQAAARWSERVERLVLLAPAVDLQPERIAEIGNCTIAEWRTTGTPERLPLWPWLRQARVRTLP
jgi:pimeloyl-ACP methyl ester carboxylesterase